MAAPAFGSSGAWNGGLAGTKSFAVPASVASGDIIVIPMMIDGSTVTITAMPTGFAHAPGSPQTVAAGFGGNHSVNVVWKRATAADTGTYDFTFSASVYEEGQAHRYTGCVASGSPWDVTTSADGGGTGNTVTPAVSVTTTGTDELLFFAGTNWGGGAWTPSTGFTERTDNSGDLTADDKVQTSAGGSGTVQATCVSTDKVGAWLGALIGTTTTAGAVPFSPQRAVQGRDPGETWWIQRDRRDANAVASAANPLPSPLDSAWQAGARYWHLYGDAADAAPRTWQSLQRNFTSDPNLLAPPATAVQPSAPRAVSSRDPGETWWQQRPGRDPQLLASAQLENELLGGAGTAQRYQTAASNGPRQWMPQQPVRQGYTPGLLDVAELENELLGGAEIAKRNLPATHADRREVPQQRSYISDPSAYPTTAPTDPLTLAWGVGGPLWWLYSTAAAQVDRREVPRQRGYISDPALLVTALLEGPLLGGADDVRRRAGPAYADRRETVPSRLSPDPAFFGPPGADPLTVAAGLGGDLWRRYNTPVTHDDRRETASQPPRWTLYFDAGPDVPPLTLSYGAGGDLWHRANWRRPARSWWPTQATFPTMSTCITPRPTGGTTIRPAGGTTARPNLGVTARPCG